MISVELVENAYFRVNNKVDVFFLVPVLAMFGLLFMPLPNYMLMIFCFVCGYYIKSRRLSK